MSAKNNGFNNGKNNNDHSKITYRKNNNQEINDALKIFASKLQHMEESIGKIESSIKKTKTQNDEYLNDTKNKIDRLEKISNRNNEYIQKLLDKEPNSKMNVFDELKRIVLRNHDTNNEEIIGRLRKIYRDILDEKKQEISTEIKTHGHDIMDKQMDLTDKMDEIQASIKENLEDNMKRLSKNLDLSIGNTKQLSNRMDDLDKILSDKNLEIHQKFPSVSHDEETIVQMAEYSRNLLEQLELAARWYARVRPEIQGLENERKQHEQDLREREKEALRKGEEKGRNNLIRDLVSSLGDEGFDAAIHGQEEDAGKRLKVISDCLANAGDEEIEDCKRDLELEITEDNIEQYRGRIANLQPGRVKIVSSGYTLSGEIISKAVCVPLSDVLESSTVDKNESETVGQPEDKKNETAAHEDATAGKSKDVDFEQKEARSNDPTVEQVEPEENAVMSNEESAEINSTKDNEVNTYIWNDNKRSLFKREHPSIILEENDEHKRTKE